VGVGTGGSGDRREPEDGGSGAASRHPAAVRGTTREPKITFESPQPTGTVSKWGVGVGYRLLDAVYSERQNEVKVGTNWKTVRISLDD